MISFIRGRVVEKRKSSLSIETPGGIGYEVAMPTAKVVGYAMGSDVCIYTYLKVSDSALELYGFSTSDERDFFTLLLSVSGVGPKTAMNILTLGPIEKIQSAIGRGDLSYLTGVSGLGKKTAERLVVELKSKIGPRTMDGGQGSSDVVVEVIEALVGMGYDRSTAKDVVTSLDGKDKNTETLLREALRKMR